MNSLGHQGARASRQLPENRTAPDGAHKTGKAMRNGGLADHLPEFMSLTDLARKVSATIERLFTGKSDQVVILRHNEPAAVLMSTERYESLISLIDALEKAEDERLATERIGEIGNGKAVSLEDAFAD